MSWIDAFIVLLLAIMWCWNLPDDSPTRRIIWPLRHVILYMGLWHGWNMFAPEPIYVNRKLSALITVKVGTGPEPLRSSKTIEGNGHLHKPSANGNEPSVTVLEWAEETAAEMGWWRAFLAARDRKLIDNLLGGHMKYLPPAISEFLCREYQAKGYEVLKVELVQTRRFVPPPEKWNELGEFERSVIWTYIPPGVVPPGASKPDAPTDPGAAGPAPNTVAAVPSVQKQETSNDVLVVRA